MSIDKITISLFFFLSALTFQVQSQIFPVQATTQLTPPYSLHLSDYVASGSERLALHVYLGDLARPELQVRFRLRIVGQNITIETKPEYLPPPVSIQGGVPLRLISTDLADYFNPNNLNFQGISRREFGQTGKLPEGPYQFCFEVLEYNRGIKISNTACAMAWLILNDPPLINLPRQNEKLKPQEPQNIVLQWTPRHTGSPNSAFSTEYEIKMVEVWPSNRNPNDAILTSPPILETTTRSTTFIYGPSEVQLEPGRRYAFRVRAKSIVGVDELDLFKNNGYSEVFSFVYGDACALPFEIKARAVSHSKVNIQWEGQPNHTAYLVQYREAGTTQWYQNTSVINETEIFSLKPTTVYEYQVAGACSGVNGTYSPVATVKTKEEPTTEYSCGLPIENFNLDPSQLTGSLSVGDIINAGDFDVKITKVTGASGTFSGEGLVVVPLMNKVKVKTEFTDILVAGADSSGYRMVKGVMNVTGAGVEIVPPAVLDFMEKLSEALDVMDSALHIVEAYLPRQGPDPISFAADTLIHMDGNILAVVRDPNSGNVIVTTTNGQVVQLPPGETYAITDNNGKGYLVDNNGGVTKTTAENAVKASRRTYNLQLHFAKATNTKHGFDEKTINALSFTYEKLGDNYFVPWKAVDATQPDWAKALLQDRTLDARSVTFVKESVNANINTPTGAEWNVGLNSITPGETGTITAFYPPRDTTEKEQVLGKLNVVGYNQKDLTLIVVPVNDAKHPFNQSNKELAAAELATELNAIYGQAVVNWRVSFVDPITVGLGTTFDAGGSGLLSNYTADMRKVIDAYGLQDNTYYLFIVNKTSGIQIDGYMPRSKQAGFLFTTANPSKENFIHTVAHELGHGAFALRHPFMEFENSIPEKSTQNLMDYTGAGANELLKYQWDRIHDPVTVIGLFEEDEEAQSVIVQNIHELKLFLNSNQKSYTFITPAGKPYTLPSDIKELVFYSNDESGSENTVYSTANYFFPDGALRGFTLADGTKYFAHLSKTDRRHFIGYRTTENGESKADDLTKELPEVDKKKVIVGLICIMNGNIQYKLRKVDYSGSVVTSVHTGAGIYSEELPVDLSKGLLPLPEVTLTADNFSQTTQYNDKAKRFLESIENCAESYNKYILSIANLMNSNEALLKNCIGLEWIFLNFTIHPACSTCVTKPLEPNSIVNYQNRYKDFLAKIKVERELGKHIQAASGAPAVRALLKESSECSWFSLDSKDRIKALKELVKESLEDCGGKGFWGTINKETFDLYNNCAEDYAIQILHTTPESQYEHMLDELIKDKLLYELISELDGAHYDELVQIITDWLYVSKKNYLDKEELFKREDLLGYMPVKIKNFGAYDNDRYYTFTYIKDNGTEVYFDFKWYNPDATGPVKELRQQKTVGLYNWVLVYFPKGFDNGLAKFPAKALVEMPAIYLDWIQFRDRQSKAITELRRSVNMAALILPFGQVNTGYRVLNATIRIVELAIPTVDLMIAGNEPDIMKLPGGPEFLEKYNLFLEIYMAASIVRMTPALYYNAEYIVKNAGKYLPYASGALKTRLENLIKKLSPVVDEAAMPPAGTISGLTGGSVFKGSFKDFQKEFTNWSIRNEGQITKYTFPNGPTGLSSGDNFLVEGPLVPNSPHPTGFVVSPKPVSPGWLRSNGAQAVAQLEAKGFTKIKSETGVGLLDQPFTPQLGESLSKGTLTGVQRGELMVLKPKVVSEGSVLVFKMADQALIVQAEGKAIQTLTEIETEARKKEEENQYCSICRERVQKDKMLCDLLNAVLAKSTNKQATEKAINRICNVPLLELTNAELKSIAQQLNVGFDGTQISELSTNINEVTGDQNNLGRNVNRITTRLIDTWRYMYVNHAEKAPNARKYVVALDRFGHLTNEVKSNIVKYSDADGVNKSTLKEFTDDLDANPNTVEGQSLTKFLNNHPQFSGGFVGHKLSTMLTLEEYDGLREELEDLPVGDNLRTTIGEWLDYSSTEAARRQYFKLGNDFEDKIKNDLKNKNSLAYTQLNLTLRKIDPNENLDNWSIFYQVYLCIGKETPCMKEGEYFIADFLLVKKKRTEDEAYVECIVVDTKLSGSTAFTKNQKTARLLQSYDVRTIGLEKLNGPDTDPDFAVTNQIRRNSKFDFIRIVSDGMGNFGSIK